VRLVAGITFTLAMLAPLSIADAKELGNAALTNVEIEDHDRIEVAKTANISYTIALNKDVAANDTVRIQLPDELTLQPQTNTDVKNTEGKVAGTATYDTPKNQVVVTLNDVAANTTYSDVTVNIPVQFDETTAGNYTVALPTKDGTKDVAYTLAEAEAAPTFETEGTLNDSSITWTATIDAHAAKISQAQLESAFGDGYDLDGDVTVTYENADGTTETRTYQSRLLADRTLKMNLGTIDKQIVTVTYDTSITSLENTYENDFTLTSLDQEAISSTAEVDGSDAVIEVAKEEEAENPAAESTGDEEQSNVTPPVSSNTISSNPSPNATGKDDVIVNNKTESTPQTNETNQLDELPQTGSSNPLWVGVACLGAAYMLLRKRGA
jgi:LPXTG-motif cell wall-anchored protein